MRFSRRKLEIFTSVNLASAMLYLDVGMTFVALPIIKHKLGITVYDAGLILIVYFVVRTSAMSICGKLADSIGHRRVFLAGILFFTAGTALSGFVPGLGFLLAARVVQALGGAVIYTVTLVILTTSFQEKERARVFAFMEMVGGAAAICGPFIGGVMAGFMGGRAIFLVNVPIGIGAFLLCRKYLPRDEPQKASYPEVRGSLLLLAFLTPLMLGLNHGNRWGWSSMVVFVLLGASALAGILFFRHNAKTEDPVLDLALFRGRYFAAGVAASFALYAGTTAAIYVVPFFLEYHLGVSPHHTGLIMGLSAGTAILSMYAGGWFSDRLGFTAPQLAGLLTAAVSLTMLLLGGFSPRIGLVIAAITVSGLSAGLFLPANYSAVMGRVPEGSLGMAAGIHSTIGSLGLIVGVVLADFAMGSWDDLSGTMLNTPGFREAIVLACLAGLAVIAAGTTAFLVITRKARKEDRATAARPEYE